VTVNSMPGGGGGGGRLGGMHAPGTKANKNKIAMVRKIDLGLDFILFLLMKRTI
jgi:hypothetical protein